ncbi:hypothetical protein NBO_19g0006 [Nosema bombycis CQ1]|uniref:Uncharacterized protein n=1 Tax=Nosema bombycis (strain CQ1 / CVCC 102059) TaxID=578461 RepID=R0MP52_NOSB1|nr:hypothetical protein NBO_19g0006 [Nosema bombycis CQ1]|eukprot:EOB14653.1 hypothetical protein NBO_19g0006 [Nosema bombycis CQ1]
MSLNVHQNLFDDKNQIDNDHVKNDINRMVDEELMDSEKNKMDDNENESNLEDNYRLDKDDPSSHANLDESQKTGNGQKNEDFCLETSNASFNDENLISDEEKLDESQMYIKEQIKDEINLSHVHVTNNDHRNRDEASPKEKSQEFNEVKNENEQTERGDLKNNNLFKIEETRAEENSQVDCNRKKNVRFRLNDEQNEKNESSPINDENFNDENIFNNDTNLNELKPPIYKTKLTNHQHEDEISHSKGYYMFHIILVMFAIISFICLFIFFVLD